MPERNDAPIADVLAACPGWSTMFGDVTVRPIGGAHCPGCASVPRLRAELERLQQENEKCEADYLGACDRILDLRRDAERKEAALRAYRHQHDFEDQLRNHRILEPRVPHPDCTCARNCTCQICCEARAALGDSNG